MLVNYFHREFYVLVSSDPLVSTVRPKVKKNFSRPPYCFTFYKRIIVIKVSNFSSIYYDMPFQDDTGILNSISVFHLTCSSNRHSQCFATCCSTKIGVPSNGVAFMSDSLKTCRIRL